MANFHELGLPGPSAIAMNLIYNTLWHNLPRKSFISGLWLRSFYGTELFPNIFTHVLNQTKWPYFRFYYKNLVLTTPGEHSLWDQATEEERIQYSLTLEQESRGKATADWNKMKELQKELEMEYKKAFPVTRGMIVGYHYSLEEQAKIIGKLNKKFLQELK